MSDDAAPQNSDPNSVRRIIGRPFQPGQSGNPGGRPRRDREVQAMFDVMTPAAMRLLAEKVAIGDLAAAQTVMRFSVPIPKAATVQLDIGPVGTAPDCLTALTRITQAIAAGEIDPVEAAPLISAVEQARKTIEVVDQETRLQALERQLKERG